MPGDVAEKPHHVEHVGSWMPIRRDWLRRRTGSLRSLDAQEHNLSVALSIAIFGCNSVD